MKATLKLIVIFGEFLLICMVVRGQTNPSPQRSNNGIAMAALQSDKNCQIGLIAEGKWPPVGYEYGEYEIPPKYWTDAIKELKPVKVYDHLLNVAIVLSIRDGAEEGIYIGNVISSYAPIGTALVNGFEFLQPEEGIHLIDFRRHRPPRFEDHPVTSTFSGKAASLQMPSSIEPRDADAIREAYSKAPHPNFAGNFIILDWPCGTLCSAMALIDAKTGDVFFRPTKYTGIKTTRSFYLLNLTYPGKVSQNPELQFRPDSSLLVIKSNDSEVLKRPYTFYYLWQGNRWTLLREVPLQEVE